MRPANQFLGGYDFIHQAQLLGFLRFEDPAGKQQVAGTLFPNLPRQKNGNNGWQKTDLHFRVPKFCFRDREREIAKRRDAESAGECVAIYCGDQRRVTPDLRNIFAMRLESS